MTSRRRCFFHDLWWRGLKNSPINTKAINDLVRDEYGNGPPARLNFTVTLAIERCDKEVLAKYGWHKRLSPEEPVFALAKAASLATTEIDKRQFMILMRQVKYTACPVTPANYAKECVCIRNRLFNTLQAVVRTPLALFMLIVDTRTNIEKASGKATSAKV